MVCSRPSAPRKLPRMRACSSTPPTLGAGPGDAADTLTAMGHSVLQVPVPPLEPFVRKRTAFHDATFLSDDPTFGHAHVTALGPFLDELEEDDATAIAAVAAAV